jgi:hypothetical protein
MGVLVPRRWCQNGAQQNFTKQAKKTQSHVKAIDRLPLLLFLFCMCPLLRASCCSAPLGPRPVQPVLASC